MQAAVHITRRDMILVSLHMLPRLRSNHILMAMLGIGLFVFLLIRAPHLSMLTVGVSAAASAIGALGGLLAGFVCSVLLMLLTVGTKSGVLGAHVYALSPEGLHERTDANEGLNKWHGIASIIRLPGYMLVRINNDMVHILPRRCFESTAAFEAFHREATALWRQAHAGAQAGSASPGA